MKLTEIIGDPHSPACIKLEDDNGEWSASVKFDGCIHFDKHYGNDVDSDYIHICDVDKMMGILKDIKKKAQDSFGEDWPR